MSALILKIDGQRKKAKLLKKIATEMGLVVEILTPPNEQKDITNPELIAEIENVRKNGSKVTTKITDVKKFIDAL